MRFRPLIVGVVFIMFAIPGYLYTPTLISHLIHSMLGSMPGSTSGTSSLLHQMGYPSRETVIKMIQYSFAGLAVTGIALLFFGAVTKKNLPKQFVAKLVMDEPVSIQQPQDRKVQLNLHSLRILQDRLAKGEITSNEFENLKRLLE
jgi:uncharacterized membrane protein